MTTTAPTSPENLPSSLYIELPFMPVADGLAQIDAIAHGSGEWFGTDERSSDKHGLRVILQEPAVVFNDKIFRVGRNRWSGPSVWLAHSP